MVITNKFLGVNYNLKMQGENHHLLLLSVLGADPFRSAPFPLSHTPGLSGLGREARGLTFISVLLELSASSKGARSATRSRGL